MAIESNRNDCKKPQVRSNAVNRWTAQQLLKMNLYRHTCTHLGTSLYYIVVIFECQESRKYSLLLFFYDTGPKMRTIQEISSILHAATPANTRDWSYFTDFKLVCSNNQMDYCPPYIQHYTTDQELHSPFTPPSSTQHTGHWEWWEKWFNLSNKLYASITHSNVTEKKRVFKRLYYTEISPK